MEQKIKWNRKSSGHNEPSPNQGCLHKAWNLLHHLFLYLSALPLVTPPKKKKVPVLSYTASTQKLAQLCEISDRINPSLFHFWVFSRCQQRQVWPPAERYMAAFFLPSKRSSCSCPCAAMIDKTGVYMYKPSHTYAPLTPGFPDWWH